MTFLNTLTDEQFGDVLVFAVSCSPRSPWVTDLVERMAEAAGVLLISQATVDALDDAHRRMQRGLPVTADEISRIEYAIHAVNRDGALRPPLELEDA